jgi:DNA-binding winged helix-turn-helix (wHTH) protein
VASPTVVRFHGFALDAGRRILSCGGRRVHLTRKAFDLLTILVGEAPLVVSKDDLHRRLWPDTFVTDATVAGVVKELRRVLGCEEAAEPLVRTVHGVGYAFTGTIQTGDRGDAADARYWLVSGTRRLMLGEGPNDIGRDPRAAVWLDSSQASRRHARIIIADETATLEDLGSKNRTLVNDRPVIEPTRLNDGDAIQIGSAIFVFRVMDTVATTETAGTNEPS